jgi:NitT/TauT family transport system ATP-binding protein
MSIEVNGIRKSIVSAKKTKELIFDNLSFQVRDSEVVGIYGPNGCGKTTLLNMIAGISKPDSGEIKVAGENPGVHTISYIFQEYKRSLYPWMTVRDNIAFPLIIMKLSKQEIAQRMEKIIDIVKLPFSLDKYPYELSGGQQQYVAILRGLISSPSAILMDEPFSAMDYSNTIWLAEKMNEIFQTIQIPVVMVAHNLDQLMMIAYRVWFMSEKPCTILEEKVLKSFAVSW